MEKSEQKIAENTIQKKNNKTNEPGDQASLVTWFSFVCLRADFVLP